MFREGLKRLFDDTVLRVLGEADAIAELVDIEPSGDRPIVVIAVDPDLSADGSRRWREGIEQQWPRAFAVVLDSGHNDRDVIAALRAGADGCLFTDMSLDALVLAIGLVSLGENVFPARIDRAFTYHAGPTERPKLTPRERDILRGLLAGHSNKLIANNLGTTDMTVKAQLRHLLRKLGVTNRTQAALWAREQGLDGEPDT